MKTIAGLLGLWELIMENRRTCSNQQLKPIVNILSQSPFSPRALLLYFNFIG
jgi:hypothetical protein